jgi:hypothetical protein
MNNSYYSFVSVSLSVDFVRSVTFLNYVSLKDDRNISSSDGYVNHFLLNTSYHTFRRYIKLSFQCSSCFIHIYFENLKCYFSG